MWGGDILAIYEDDLNEGPPRLYGQGYRVKPGWLHYFLSNVHTLRPWLKIRMPSFHYNNDQLNKIVTGFQAKSRRQTFAKRVLSTNNEKWNTIYRTFAEIDTLRNKFKADEGKLEALEEINSFVEELEKNYQKAS